MRPGQYDSRLGGKHPRTTPPKPADPPYAERCKCGAPFESEQAWEHRQCDSCAIDQYEELQRRREQAYLEDDRNWDQGAR